MSPSAHHTPHIAIIGAGPAGTTLARLLQTHSIHVTIFEKDPSPAHRTTAGGSLDLHEGSGQLALREARLWDAFQKHARYDGQCYIISDETGRRYIDISGVELGRPEIDRPQLRDLLLDSLAEGTVKWGTKLKKADPDGTLVFERTDGRGEEEKEEEVVRGGTFDLVVGADGAWSKVRALLSTVPPFYAGLSGYEMWIKDPDRSCPAVSKSAGNGSHFAFGRDERCLIVQRQADRGLQVYTYMRKPEGWHEGNGVGDHADREEVKRCVLRELDGWAPEFKDVIEAVDGPVVPRSLYMVHVGTRWLHKRGFTAIGDAAHLMTPFAGEGVNAAMHDALVLAREIIKRPEDVDAAAEAYEKEMFPRAAAFQQATWDSLMERFEPGGNEKFAEGLRQVAEDIQGGLNVKDGSKPDKLFNRN